MTDSTRHHVTLGLPAALTVTICGGGSGGHAVAAYLGSKPGVFLNVLTRQPEKWSQKLSLVTEGSSWEAKGEICGVVHRVSADAADVIPESDLVLILSPAHTHRDIMRKVAPHLRKGAILGCLYCQGGFDWVVRQVCGEEVIARLDGFFGLMNIPWLCKTIEYGSRVRLIGPKKNLNLAAYPPQHQRHYCLLMSVLFDIPCRGVPNFLSLTLVPSNQIIHPARYYGIFSDWDGKKVYSEEKIKEGLYTGFCEKSAEELSKLDADLQRIKEALLKIKPELDLSVVVPIGQRIVDHYGEDVKDTSSLRRIFQTNKGYAGCRIPHAIRDGGVVPDTKSRLFVEDVPFGLVVLRGIADIVKVDTPAIDAHIRWHQQFMPQTYLLEDGKLNKEVLADTGAPAAYGIHTVDDLVKFSLP